jgi:hypothetical protein
VEVLCQPAGGVQHVAHVLEGEVAVGQEGCHDRLGHHPDQEDALPGYRAHQIEEPVQEITAEDVARHVLGGRHPFERCLGEQLTGEEGMGKLEPEAVRQVGVDLEGVPES